MPVGTVVDLFCGCGGLSAGFRSEGFEILLGADLNKFALKTFQRNFPDAIALNADLSAYDPALLLGQLGLEAGELDCLIGGPPCQGFSKNVPARHRWLEDPRNQLIGTFLRFVEALRPKFVLIENVAEMLGAYKEAYTSDIRDTFDRMGYVSENERLLAASYGVPQLRRRAFFFANRLGLPVEIPRPTALQPGNVDNMFASRWVTVWEAISDLPSLASGEGSSPRAYPTLPETDYQKAMRAGSELLHDHVARKLAPAQLERVSYLKPGQGEGVEALPAHLRPKSGYSGAYARLIPGEPARTITRWVFHPGSGRFFHPYDNRVVTIREAARLQSFPDWFVFEGTYIQKAHQVGEAVPPLLTQAFAREVKGLIADGLTNSSMDLRVQSSLNV